MTLRTSDEQTEALRRQAAAEGRSMQAVALSAIDEYIARRAAGEDQAVLARPRATISASEDQRFTLVIRVATGGDHVIEEIAALLRAWSHA